MCLRKLHLPNSRKNSHDPCHRPRTQHQGLCSIVCSHTIHSSWKNKGMPRMCQHLAVGPSAVCFKKVPLTTDVKISLQANKSLPTIMLLNEGKVRNKETLGLAHYSHRQGPYSCIFTTNIVVQLSASLY